MNVSAFLSDCVLLMCYHFDGLCLFVHIHQGENVPPPFTSFGDTGFPPEILREVLNLTLCSTYFVFVRLCPGLAIKIVSFARLHDLSFPLQSGGPALSLKTHFIFPSLYLFLSQVRYLLQGGAKCRTLCRRFLWGALIWSTIICQGAF